jgi:hypothetical protein
MAKYRSMQGKEVDMDKLMRQNELMPAIGNVKVNARGDELGPGGRIVKKREDIIAEYYENNPKAIPDRLEPIPAKKAPKPVVEPVQVQVQAPKKNKSKDEE